MNTSTQEYVRLHVRFGWWSLLLFLTLGITLEALHGFKVAWYLDVSNETRRLVWRLAHAHGALLGVVHIAFAFTLTARPAGPARWHRLASLCLMGASVLLPGGFLLGGMVVYGGDPGLGIFLTPLGALLFFAGVLCVAVDITRRQDAAADAILHGPSAETGAASRQEEAAASSKKLSKKKRKRQRR